MNALLILEQAAKHQRDRAANYDKPAGERSMAQTVKVFEAHHGIKLTEAQGWHFMQILKDVRLFTATGYHADSAEDCVSYAALKAEAKHKEMMADAARQVMAKLETSPPAEDPDGHAGMGSVKEDDGWIEWNGGNCPVPPNTRVEYLSRGWPENILHDVAVNLSWQRIGKSSDIIRYRILK